MEKLNDVEITVDLLAEKLLYLIDQKNRLSSNDKEKLKSVISQKVQSYIKGG